MPDVRMLGLGAAAMCLPVYITPAPPYIHVSGIIGSGGVVHWGLLLAPLLLVVGGSRQPARIPRLSLALTALGAWLGFALLLGQFNFDGSLLLGISFYLQLLLPVASLLVGLRLSTCERGATAALRYLLIGLTAFQGCLIIKNWAAISSGSPHTVAQAFPQFLTYYPGLLALGSGLAVLEYSRARPLSVVFLASVGLVMPAVWSRIGLIMICSALGCGLVVSLSRDRAKRLTATRFFTYLVGLVAATTVMLFFVRNALGGALGARLADKGGDVLQSGRGHLISQALALVLDHPLLGDAGRPRYDRGDFGGMEGLGLRLFPSHSQLLDLGVRGGVPAMLIGLMVAGLLLTYGWAALRRGGHGSHNVLPGVVVVMIGASVSDLYFTQAITAIPGWLLIGVGLGALQLPAPAESKGQDRVLGNQGARARPRYQPAPQIAYTSCSTTRDPSPIIPAPTVPPVASSTRMKEPVVRLRS